MSKFNKLCVVRPLTKDQIPQVINYFLQSDEKYLTLLGTDITKIPSFDSWYDFMSSEHEKTTEQKSYYCLGWYYDDKLIGHSCIDNIVFGDQAKFHLHIWQQDLRHMHLGSSFLWLSLKDYFGKFKLKQLVCEPNAHNEPPNKLLRKIGARKIKTYETIPHPICLKQMVSRYEIDKDSFKELTTTFE